MGGRYSVAFVTCPKGAASRIAKEVVAKRAAACVSIISGVSSTYLWKGKVENASECMLVMKTRAELLPKLENAVKKAHPYNVPEIIAFRISRGSKPYLDWIGKETRTL